MVKRQMADQGRKDLEAKETPRAGKVDIAKLPVCKRTRRGRAEYLDRKIQEEYSKKGEETCGSSKRRRMCGWGKYVVGVEVIPIGDSEDDDDEFVFDGVREVGTSEDDIARRIFCCIDDENFEEVEAEEKMKEEEEEEDEDEEDEEEEEEEEEVEDDYDDQDEFVFEGEREGGTGQDDIADRAFCIIDDEDDDSGAEVVVEEKKKEAHVKVKEEDRKEEDDVEDDEDDDEEDDSYVGVARSETDSDDGDNYEDLEEEENDHVDESCKEKEVNQINVKGSDGKKEVISVIGNGSDDEDVSTRSSTAEIKHVKLKKRYRDTGRNGNIDEEAKGIEENDDQEPESKSTKKKLGRRALEDMEVQKILAASILEKGEGGLSSKETHEPPPPAEWKLPLKFFFGEPEPPLPPEKSEWETQIDDLWSEMDLSISQNNGNRSQMDKDDPDAAAELDKATRCSRGNHHLILNEEIGLMCKYCYHVGVEIRYCCPPMSENLFGRSDRKAYSRMPNDNDINSKDLDFESNSAADPTVDFSGTVWSIIPGIRRGMHPHQIDGFEFLWKNIAGGIRLDDVKGNTSSSRGSGCIISHAPGTGKSRLTIAFLETYTKLYPSSKPIIIAPASMLQTWEAEFLKWKVEVPFHNLNNDKLTGKENKAALKLLKPGGHSAKSIRLIKLYSWKMGSSVLALSYRLYEELTGGMDRKSNRSKPKEDHKVWKALLDLPGLLILDEGHTPRNSDSLIWKALSKMHTGKKIILSGTPFQNNFEELFNILCLVRPEFADKFSSGSYTGPHGSRKSDAREYWDSVTSAIGKSANQNLESKRVDQVREMIAPFVHVHKGHILQERLPGLRDSVVILEPSGVQKILLERIGEEMSVQNFEYDHAMSVACVHPYLYSTKSCEPFPQKKKSRKPAPQKKKSHEPSSIEFDSSKSESLKMDPDDGVKTKFLMELVQLSTLVKEKVLVFSQYVEPLNLISTQLQRRFHWSEKREILLMHGKCRQDQRQASLLDFNDPHSLSKVMLASTKACSEGISLVGASRVVLLDVVWNPSVGKQAISRAYRLGQNKVVHIYHLIASAKEEEKYMKQAEKERLSELVIYSVDEPEGSKKFSSTFTDYMKDRLLEQMIEGDKLKNIFKKIIYQPKERNLIEAFSDE